MVVQTKPASRILGDFRDMVRQIAGPAEADKAIKSFENGIKETLGEQGFEGLDTNRPLGAYVILREQVRDTTAILVVPVTGEKEFVGLLERMKMKATPVKDKNGVYTLELREGAAAAILPKGAALQFAGPWAYVTLNGEAADPKDLLGPADLFDNADQSLVTVKFYPDRFPEKLLKGLLQDLDNTVNGIKGFAAAGPPPHIARMLNTFFEEGPKLVRRYAETGQKEAAELALRLGWDAATGAGTAELVVTPKPGTSLAKDIAAHAVFTNRFAGLISKDVAVGGLVQAPLYAPEVRAIVASALEAGQDQLKEPDGFPKQFHPLVDEVAKSLIGSVKKGQLDAAVAMHGPDKAGKFTLVGGLSLDNAKAVEKAARNVVKGQNFAKLVQLDVAKVGDINIHKVALLSVFPERDRVEIAKAFGPDAPGYAAFAADAVFFAFGSDALEHIKSAIASKPWPRSIARSGGEHEAPTSAHRCHGRRTRWRELRQDHGHR